MKNIYLLTLNKYRRSGSTWIIFALTLFITFFVSGYIPFQRINENTTANEYAVTALTLVSLVTVFTSIFASIFTGFKTATMYRDEVEDGTFLVMLSKPISRVRILLGKWLALQTILLIYTFTVTMGFAIGVAIWDNGDIVKNLEVINVVPLKNKIFGAAMIMFLIIFVFTLILSSITLLISLKISVGATIGIAIALGVLIPISGLVGTLSKDERSINTTSESTTTIRNNAEILEGKLGANTAVPTEIFEWSKYMSNTETGLKDISVTKNYGSNTYDFLKIFDINSQLSVMATYAVDLVIDDVATLGSDEQWRSIPGLKEKRWVKDNSHPFNIGRTEIERNAEFETRLADALYYGQNIEKIWTDALDANPLSFSESETNLIDTFIASLPTTISDIIDMTSIKNIVRENDLPTPIINDFVLQPSVVDEATNSVVDKIKVSETDKEDFRAIKSVIDSDRLSFLGVKPEDYFNRDILLALYIVIAIGLIPLVGWLIGKQDFR